MSRSDSRRRGGGGGGGERFYRGEQPWSQQRGFHLGLREVRRLRRGGRGDGEGMREFVKLVVSSKSASSVVERLGEEGGEHVNM